MPFPLPCADAARTALYRRRRPERTVLYRVVQEHLETWLVHRHGRDGGPLPPWVEGEFRRFLACGILAHGFARARCADCGARCADCGHDFLVAFSCKGRGVCPSCNTRRMAEIAAHLVEHVFPRLPVRQWVLSLPKRLRYFVQRDAALAGRVLGGFLRAVEAQLRTASPGAPADARFGGVTFVQRFGAALNAHLHFHGCLIDGVFAADGEGMRFYEATALGEADVAAVQEVVRRRVLKLFERQAVIDPQALADMRQWAHGGFSLDATIRIEAWDRAGLERLLRYCARPVFAGERLSWAETGQRLVYRLPQARPDGQRVLALAPLELLDRLAVLVPPPRVHRHRYHGVLAPNARLRRAVTALANQAVAGVVALPPAPGKGSGSAEESATRYPSAAVRLWAALLARIYEVFPLVCPRCGGEVRLIAFLTERAAIERILTHLGEPTVPPAIAAPEPESKGRAPPHAEAEFDQRPARDVAEPVPDIDFDQTQGW